MGRKREGRTALRIPLDHLPEQVNCLRQLLSLIRQAVRKSTQKQIVRGQIGGGVAAGTSRLGGLQGRLDHPGNGRGYLS
jgi:hypothetical protein